jgi:hypothetical protein
VAAAGAQPANLSISSQNAPLSLGSPIPAGTLPPNDRFHRNKAYNERNALGRIFHEPDTIIDPNTGQLIQNPNAGKMSKDALLSLMSGIGTMASSPSLNFLPTLLQGGAGFANTYAGQETRRAGINQSNADAALTRNQSYVVPYTTLGGVTFKAGPNGPELLGNELMGGPGAVAGALANAPPALQEAINRENEAAGTAGYADRVQADIANRDAVTKAATDAEAVHNVVGSLSTAISQSASQGGLDAMGAGSPARTAVVSALNTLLRAVGEPEIQAGVSDTQAAIIEKARSILGSHGSQLNSTDYQVATMLASLPSPGMSPQAATEMMASTVLNQQRAIDRREFYKTYTDRGYGNTLGTTLFADGAFDKQMSQQYQYEKKLLSDLFLARPDVVTDLYSGKYDAAQVQQLLASVIGADRVTPGMYRYFVTGY